MLGITYFDTIPGVNSNYAVKRIPFSSSMEKQEDLLQLLKCNTINTVCNSAMLNH